MLFNNTFKPWGEVSWLIDKSSIKKWDLICCLATEERCLSTAEIVNGKGILGNTIFYEIIDPVDTAVHQSLRDQSAASLKELNLNQEIEKHQLLEPLSKIVDSITAFLNKSCGSIILDISCFPKRFFFPIIKFILRSENLQNLIVTYSCPEEYSLDNLAENPQPWMNIPTFKSNDEDGTEVVIIGVGFMPLGLPDFLGNDNQHKKQINLFFPFPPGPPSYQRTWTFVKEISEYRPIHPKELIRMEALNVPEVFNRICAITDGGNKKVVFAPYGPKPFSLAMCLHACKSNSSVYYTQPMHYNPHYSKGVGNSLGYLIVSKGVNLYEI